jgi:response regulator RpfG family c-di-GMP phosphodiesterase
MNEAKTLFVDDEINVLNAFKRVLRNSFPFDIAESGHRALELMEQNGPYAVVFSDMQMPEMSGLELLKTCRRRWPETVRVMLTGNVDQQTAVSAINEGDVFRFINKPISPETIKQTMIDSLDEYRRAKAEREILELTLTRTVDVLSDILALVKPEVFGRMSRLRELAMAICEKLDVRDRWQVEVAVTLSQLGCISVPDELINKVMQGQQLADEAQQRLFDGHYALGAQMVEKIPRLENVANSIRLVTKNYDGSGNPADRIAGEQIPFESRMLKILNEFDCLDSRLGDFREALRIMTKDSGRFDPKIFEALVEVIADLRNKARIEIRVHALEENMQIARDVFNEAGLLLVASGQTVTPAIKHHLQSFVAAGALKSDVITVIAEPQVRADGAAR